MLPALSQFAQNVEQVRSVINLAGAIDQQTTSVLDVSDIYRSALVLLVSAWDQYVHERTLQGMLEVHSGERPATDSYLRFRVRLETMQLALSDRASSDWLQTEVRQAHSYVTFQRSDAVADALRLFSTVRLWHTAGAQLGREARYLKDTLDVIVDRRNKIAHEADCEPNGLGTRWPMTQTLVREATDFVEELVRVIDNVV